MTLGLLKYTVLGENLLHPFLYKLNKKIKPQNGEKGCLRLYFLKVFNVFLNYNMCSLRKNKDIILQ